MKITTQQQNTLIIIVIIMICILASSCTSLKKISSNKIKETTKKEIKHDSVSKIQINEAIDDSIITTISDSGDPELNNKIDDILRKLNTSKSSGANNYKLYYDEKLREIRAEFEIGETKNEKTDIVNSEKSELTFEENVSEYIKKVVVPWWAYVILFIFIWPYIKPFVMGLLRIALGPANVVTMLGDFKKKNL